MICSSFSKCNPLLLAPKPRFKIPKRIPTLLDLNKETKNEKYISFDLLSKLDTLPKCVSRPSSESVSTNDEEHENNFVNKEEDCIPRNGVVVSVLDIISQK